MTELPAQDVAPLADCPRSITISGAQDISCDPLSAFALICQVEKWPVWLSFLRSARRTDGKALSLGSEVAVRGSIPGNDEELYEVDHYVDGHVVSLVGAYSVRRRIDLRVERVGIRGRVVARFSYPVYRGLLGSWVDRLTVRRKLEAALGDSLVHLKGLVEYNRDPAEALADF
jgi:hypothetical protein